jgi:TfoX/Sxy family transcriptional regulator of competence genes
MTSMDVIGSSLSPLVSETNGESKMHASSRPHLYDDRMAYDEQLAQRIRDLVAGEAGVEEKTMFGGLAFLVNGNMAVAASGQGGLLVRVDPEESDTLVRESGVEMMEMRGREMPGWLRVEETQVATKKQLSAWVGRGVAFARSLPAKR